MQKPKIMVQHTDPAVLLERIDEFVELGVGLELRDFMLPSLLDSPDLSAWLDAYREVNMGRLTFSVHSPVIDLNMGSLDDRIRGVSTDRIIQGLKVVKGLSAKFLVVHTGYDHRFLKEENRFESWLARSMESFRTVFRRIHPPDCLSAICVENSPGEPFEPYQTYIQCIRREFPRVPFRACVDYGHLSAKEKSRLNQRITNPVVAYLHIPLGVTGYSVYRNLPSRHRLKAICFEGQFGKKEKQSLKGLMPSQ